MKNKKVNIITLNFNGEKIVPKLLDSLKSITYSNYDVTVVDNGSVDNSVALIESKYPNAKLIKNKTNLFFSRGNNIAIDQTKGDYLLLINNDIVVTPTFLDEMVTTIEKRSDIAAVASKMLFDSHPEILDSAGVVINSAGWPFNRGIGQVDLGQYDVEEQVMGACFGCVLIRRDVYLDSNKVGRLDNRYFGYFEDVDWSLRANEAGYKIIYQPKAVVYHAHSVTSRKKPSSWKQFLIHRNFIWTVFKNFERKRAFRFIVKRYLEFLKQIFIQKNSLSDKYLSFKILFFSFLGMPIMLGKRFKIQRNRKVTDEQIYSYAEGEQPFFEDVNYEPIYTLDNLQSSLLRLSTNDSEYNTIYFKIKKLNESKNSGINEEWEIKARNTFKMLKITFDSVKILDTFEKKVTVEKTWQK